MPVNARILGSTLLAAALLVGSVAHADEPVDKVACARSYERGQRLRRSRELRAAREELLVCSRAECPATLRKECEQWLGQVEAATPTLVVVAKTADGSPATDVHIRIDGELITDQASHAPIPLDPGVHVVRVESGGVTSIEQRVTLREGDRERRVEMTFAAPEPHANATTAEGPPRPTTPPSGSESDAQSRPVPVLTWVLGGSGLAVVAIGSYFQLSGMSKRSDLSSCTPHCPQADVDDARSTLWIGNIVLGVGVVALAAATIVYLTR